MRRREFLAMLACLPIVGRIFRTPDVPTPFVGLDWGEGSDWTTREFLLQPSTEYTMTWRDPETGERRSYTASLRPPTHQGLLAPESWEYPGPGIFGRKT